MVNLVENYYAFEIPMNAVVDSVLTGKLRYRVFPSDAVGFVEIPEKKWAYMFTTQKVNEGQAKHLVKYSIEQEKYYNYVVDMYVESKSTESFTSLIIAKIGFNEKNYAILKLINELN